MITKDNLKDLLLHLGFSQKDKVFSKKFDEHDCELAVDFKSPKLIYPESKGLKINERPTCNFSSNENFVVFECVHRLLAQGYKPESIELEPKWKVGHGASGGRADILVKNRNNEPLLIIECKTAGKEFNKAWKDTLEDGAQLFSYIEQEKAVEFVALYAGDFENDNLALYQRIISHKDNEKILSEQASLKSFKDAKNVKDRYKVWKETYKLEYTEKGLFEKNIQPYQIGKDKYALEIDTTAIEASDKKGKYHQFRTILRKYNVSRRENAFEVLVNLFLCKIVDETENPNDLKFYWKGIAYDNYYDLVDRLQSLYKIGMDKFLKQDIVYISNQDIDNAFWTMSQKRSATKNTIKEIFRQLKFFKGLDFDFIKVHNQTQFEKNAKILLEMIQMWQGLRLLSAGQNQFLGDMFEFFLDNGIKQSEGQFFTPVPICKFIVASLPLEGKIIESNEPIKAIDYACGSGHFLNEFASAITPLVKEHKQVELSNYYQNIIGIEKEDRLAKVAKVSAFMYGQDQINIIEQDALNGNELVKEDSFDCLVANPPFAVEDFLLTLDEDVRESYELLETINDIGNKNIQCFFLERAKQLLAPNGVTGIIVPSSILNNTDNIHIKTREILLRNFDIVSIVELGAGTFGKTGTNTVVLFMRRKPHKPSMEAQFSNRVKDFFEDWETEYKSGGGAYSDLSIVENYCEHQEIEFADYQSLLKGEHSETLFNTEKFSEYTKAFENLASTKNYKKSAAYKSKSGDEKVKGFQKRLLLWVIAIEKDKLFYFMLAFNNAQNVLVIKSPSDNKAIKEFLGYEWSGAKGSEGIRYANGETVYDIETPLYNPNNSSDNTKINKLISDNFNDKEVIIPEVLKKYVQSMKLVDMLDFYSIEFNKVINLNNITNSVELLDGFNKYPKERLSKLADTNPPRTEISSLVTSTKVSFIEMASVSNDGFITEKVDKTISELKGGSFTYFKENDLIFAKITPSMENGKCAVATGLTNKVGLGSTEFHVIRPKESPTNKGHVINNYYLFNLLNNVHVRVVAESNMTGASGHRRVPISFYENLRIPVPPIEIQNEIVQKCADVDQKVLKSRQALVSFRSQIDQLVLTSFKETQKLNNIIEQKTAKVDPQSKSGNVNYIGLENIKPKSGKLVSFEESEYRDIKSSKTVFSKGDILYGKLRPNLNKVYLAEFEGICSTDILVLKVDSPDLAKFYSYYFRSNQFNAEVLKTVSGQQLPRTSYQKMSNIVIPKPNSDELELIIKEINTIEVQINNAITTVSQSEAEKLKILKSQLS